MKSRLIMCFILSASFAQSSLWGELSPKSHAQLRVILANCVDSKPVGEAVVKIIGRSGNILAKGTTDANGQVDLELPEKDQSAQYLLAEHPLFFIGGVVWKDGYEERFISLAPLAGL